MALYCMSCALLREFVQLLIYKCRLYIDRHLIHEWVASSLRMLLCNANALNGTAILIPASDRVTTPQAFEGLRNAGRGVRRPDCTLAVSRSQYSGSHVMEAKESRALSASMGTFDPGR